MQDEVVIDCGVSYWVTKKEMKKHYKGFDKLPHMLPTSFNDEGELTVRLPLIAMGGERAEMVTGQLLAVIVPAARTSAMAPANTWKHPTDIEPATFSVSAAPITILRELPVPEVVRFPVKATSSKANP